MSFIFHCPHCNQKFDCDDTFDGQDIECPSCMKTIKIRKHQKENQPEKRYFKNSIYISGGVSVAVLILVAVSCFMIPKVKQKIAEKEFAQKQREIEQEKVFKEQQIDAQRRSLDMSSTYLYLIMMSRGVKKNEFDKERKYRAVIEEVKSHFDEYMIVWDYFQKNPQKKDFFQKELRKRRLPIDTEVLAMRDEYIVIKRSGRSDLIFLSDCKYIEVFKRGLYKYVPANFLRINPCHDYIEFVSNGYFDAKCQICGEMIGRKNNISDIEKAINSENKKMCNDLFTAPAAPSGWCYKWWDHVAWDTGEHKEMISDGQIMKLKVYTWSIKKAIEIICKKHNIPIPTY